MNKRNKQPKTGHRYLFRGVLLLLLLSVFSAMKAEVRAQTGQIIITSGDNACVGQNIALTASISGVDEIWVTNSEYRWSITSGNGTLSASSGDMVNVIWDDVNGGTVRVTYAGSKVTVAGTDITVTAGTKTLAPYASPNVVLSAPTLVGEGKSFTLNASGATGVHAWRKKPASQSYFTNISGSGTSLTTSITENTTFGVTGYNVYNCGGSQEALVSVVKKPTFTTLGGGITFNSTYSAQATPGANGTTCKWYTSPDGVTPVATGTSVSLPVNNTGKHTFYVASVNGSVESSRVSFNVTRLSASASHSAGPNFSCGGDNVTLSGHVSGPTTFNATEGDPVSTIELTYQWYEADQSTLIGSGPTLNLGLVSAARTVYLRVTATPQGLGSASVTSGFIEEPLTPGTAPNKPQAVITNCGTHIQLSGAGAGETYYVAVVKREMNDWLAPTEYEDTDGDGIITLPDTDKLTYSANLETYYRIYTKRGACKSEERVAEFTRFDDNGAFDLTASHTSANCGTNVTYTLTQGGNPIVEGVYGVYRWKIRTKHLTLIDVVEEFTTTAATITKPLKTGVTTVEVTIVDDKGCERPAGVNLTGSIQSVGSEANPLMMSDITFNNCGVLKVDNPQPNTTYLLFRELADRTTHGNGTTSTDWVLNGDVLQSTNGVFNSLPLLDADSRFSLAVLLPSGCLTSSIQIYDAQNSLNLLQNPGNCLNANITVRIAQLIKGAVSLTWQRQRVSDGAMMTPVTGTLSDLTHTFLGDAAYDVWAEVTDDLGCVKTYNKLRVTPSNPPTAPVLIIAEHNCQNGNFLLRAQGGGEGDTYKWYKGSLTDPNPVTTTKPYLLVEGLEIHLNYYVTITNSVGCEGAFGSQLLEGKAIPKKPTLKVAPESMLDPYEEDLDQQGNKVLKYITVEVSGATAGQTYVWTQGGIAFPDSTDSKFVGKYPETTCLTVAIKSANGCVGEPIVIPVRIRHDYNGVTADNLNMVSTQIIRVPNVKTESQLDTARVIVGTTLRSNTYLDGLGRFTQSVSQEVTPDKQDAVKTVLYDDIGRRSIEYMGYNSGSNNGVYKPNAITGVEAFYEKNAGVTKDHATSRYPYAQVNYEPSPLNRSFKSFAPGKSWVGNEKGGEVCIRTNVANEVRKWQVNNAPGSGEVTTGQEELTLNALQAGRTLYQAKNKITLTEGFSVPETSPTITLELRDGDGNKPGLDGYYAAGELLVTKVTDVDGKVTETYTNKYGQVILKRAKVKDGLWAETYNVYNKFNQLSYVLSPEAVKTLKDNHWQWEHEGKNVCEDVMRLTYRYYYDARGRAIIKEVPNAGKTLVVYDDLNRPVLTQDAKQRALGKWDFVKYDSLSRPVVSGIYTSSETRANLQASLDQGFCTTYKRFENFDASETINHYYTNQTFPSTSIEVLSVNYYDDYRWQQIQAGFNMSSEFSDITGTEYYKHVLGAPTAGKVKVMDNNGGFLFSAIYYDERGRIKQTISENHLGGKDIGVQEYKFDGQVTQTVMKHQRQISVGTYENHYTNQWMKYDHVGRVLEAYHKITDTYAYKTLNQAKTDLNPEPISKAEYNKLGQVIASRVGKDHQGNTLQTINYKFNIRGWLTHLNDAGLSTKATDNDLFGFELKYEEGGTHTYLSGNIARMVWKSALDGENVTRQYDYQYDGMNRLKKATYSDTDASTAANFTVDGGIDAESGLAHDGIQYDLNGNIKQLRRYGLINANTSGNFGVIDDLKYSYKGNQLLGVDDATDGNTVTGVAKDFRDKHKYATSGQEYYYDDNGNLTQDKNKEITSITYNRFDMPEEILFSTGAMIEFTYDGSGSKLSKEVTDKDGNSKTTDYVAGFVYEEGHLQFVSTGIGRALYTPNNLAGQSLGTGERWVYEYYYTDHQGNMRMSFRKGQAITTHARMEDASQDKTVNGFEYDANVVATSPTGNGQSAKVGADTKPLGIWKTIAVSKGDQVEMKVQSYISGAPANTNNAGLELFVTNLVTGYNAGGERSPNNPNTLAIGVSYAPGTEPTQSNTLPSAYLRYVFYNDKGEAVKSDRIYVTDLANGAWQQLMLNFTAETNGTLQIYTANESDTKVVYFDNMEVTFTPQIIAQETHYYPFGMQMAGIGKQGMIHNRFLYNGQTEREESFGLMWDETPFRRYDPQLGRFHGVDALASMMPGITPYQYAFNNPIMMNDPSGLAPASGRRRVVDINREKNGGSIGNLTQQERGGWRRTENGAITYNSSTIKSMFDSGGGSNEGAAETGRKDKKDMKGLFKKMVKKSKIFAQLAKKANVNEDNFDDNVLDNTNPYKQNTHTDSYGIIFIHNKESKTDEQLMIEMAHEMYNRANIKVLQDAGYQVTFGDITPEEYGEKLVDFEKYGILFQFKVQAELGIKVSKKRDQIVKWYLNKQLSDKDILESTKKGMMKTLYVDYVSNGRTVRRNYLSERRYYSNKKEFEAHQRKLMINGYKKIREKLGIK